MAGKVFEAGAATGANVFSGGARFPSRALWLGCRGYGRDARGSYRAFGFWTWVGPGFMDPDVEVLKIDYDLPPNPRLSIRRVLDELVQADDGLYLGKAHLRWWWGRWQTVAYFALRGPVGPEGMSWLSV